MSLAKKLNGGKQKTKLHISQIRENPKNAYMNDEYYAQESVNNIIEAIANSIEKHGQLHNAVVYADKDNHDGKEYTLLSGAKRYRAIALLAEQGRGDGMIDVVIQDAPSDVAQEVDIISDGNIQGNPALKDHKLLYQEILLKEQQYDELKQNGEIPKGLFKRVYVSTHLGIAEGTVTNIKNEFEGTKTEKPKKKKTPKQLQKENRLAKFKEVGQTIYEDAFGSCCDGIKLTDKELSFKYSSLEDLEHLLELMNVDVSIDELKEV